MRNHQKRRPRQLHCRRKGVAAVEFAIVTPLIALILLGSIDVGQAIYVAQVVNEASREAARQGARFDTTSASAVAANIREYIRENSSGMSNAVVEVNFTDRNGVPIPNGNLAEVSSGTAIVIQVTLQFDSVRWLPGVPVLEGKTIATTTIMRRE